MLVGTITDIVVAPPELAVEDAEVLPVKYAVVFVPFRLTPVIVIEFPRVTGLGVIATIDGVPVNTPVEPGTAPPHPARANTATDNATIGRHNLRTIQS